MLIIVMMCVVVNKITHHMDKLKKSEMGLSLE